MDVSQARRVLVDEFERIFQLPQVEAEAELQQLFVAIDETAGDGELLKDLEEMLKDQSLVDGDSESRNMALGALRRIQ